MRLFAFDNERLKYVFQGSYVNQENLELVFIKSIFDWLKSKTESNTLNSQLDSYKNPIYNAVQAFYINSAKKGSTETEKITYELDVHEVLDWTTAISSLRSIKITGDFGEFLQTKPPWPQVETSESTCSRKIWEALGNTSAYDIYLELGTGWCALARNYSIYMEVDENGQIGKTQPTTDSGLFPLIPNDGGTVVSNYLQCINFINNLFNNIGNIIPHGLGNFYGKKVPMTKNSFENLSAISSSLTNAVRAVVYIEWPVVFFDQGYTDWFAKANPNSSKTDPGKFTPLPELTPQFDTLNEKRKKWLNINSEFFAQSANGQISASTGSKAILSDAQKVGNMDYLGKLRLLDDYLSFYSKQIYYLTTAYNFDNSQFELSWYQELYSAFLYSMGVVCDLVATIIGVEMGGKSPIPGLDLGEMGSNLFNNISNYFYEKQQRYRKGDQEATVSESIENLTEGIMLTYGTFEFFLLKWGLVEVVTSRSQKNTIEKLSNINLFMEAKSKRQNLMDLKDLSAKIHQIKSPN